MTIEKLARFARLVGACKKASHARILLAHTRAGSIAAYICKKRLAELALAEAQAAAAACKTADEAFSLYEDAPQGSPERRIFKQRWVDIIHARV